MTKFEESCTSRVTAVLPSDEFESQISSATNEALHRLDETIGQPIIKGNKNF